MERDLTEQSISVEQFNEVEKRYEDVLHTVVLEALHNYHNQNAGHKDRLIDIGCGPGNLTVKASVGCSHVILVDCSVSYLKTASKLLASTSTISQTSVIGDVTKISTLHDILKSTLDTDATRTVVLMSNVSGYLTPSELYNLFYWLAEYVQPDAFIFNLFLKRDNPYPDREKSFISQEDNVFTWDLGFNFSLRALTDAEYTKIVTIPGYTVTGLARYHDFKSEQLITLSKNKGKDNEF